MEYSKVAKPLASVVRGVYLGRLSGLVEVERDGDQPIGVFFRRGELHLDRDDPTAQKISPLLARAGSERPAADPELVNAVQALARELCPDPGVKARFRGDQAIVVELIGPLPTVRFVQELAIHGCDESRLLERLGGESVRLQSSDVTPALKQLPGLEPDMAGVLVNLAQPASVRSLVRGAGKDRLSVLRGLTKLWSIGLVSRAGGADSSQGWGEKVLSPRLVVQFTERIAEDLESRPLVLDAGSHRARLGELLSGLGEMNYYQLLSIDPRAGSDEIFAAYGRLARIVHPSHASRLGLEGKEVAVRVIFERATEAYLTLSDPRRRASYNTVAGIRVHVAVDREQRDEEKRSLAEQNYRRAASCLSQMDYSLAVDLLKEAARMDPKPEYYARLGLAQSKNPNWHRHAVESYRRAVELDPDNAGTRTAYGTLLEEMDLLEEAREQYREALDLMSDNPDAQAGLDRLGGGISSLAPKVGGFRNLFAKSGKQPA